MTAPTRPPLHSIGVVDDNQYGTLVHDIYENVPDLHYPHSVEIYALMRRDPRLAAVLAGYTLQLRRAQWQLDGTGCRPEVVQLVADGLGLNVKGQDARTGASRHNVSWNEHLRSALNSLTFGHSGFELIADVSSGQARLATLAERLPQSVSAIHADPKTGALLGIDQMITGRRNSPQIRADRLAWYTHEREGAGWQGVSLLRPAYSPWLVKREMVRVHAISNRRWGAGVPVMEALAGTNPSPEQMRQAQELASAARAGDQAGAAAPPGFTLRIAGLSGAVPDTLAFLEWLNREMSSAALMPHLDLGQGSNGGSRALGQSFLDSWTLSLETIGENIADTATRQIAARIVDWNWGEDEPVPIVAVAGVGSRREVTAESLDLLLSSGALSADPELEAWVRREYRLPERTGPPPTTSPPTPSAPAPAPAPPAPVPAPAPAIATRLASRRSRRKEPSPGQLALPILAAAPDLTQLQTEWEQVQADQLEQWPIEASALVDALAVAAGAAVAAGLLANLGSLAAGTAVVTGIAGFLTVGMTTVASGAAALAVAEVVDLGGAAAVPGEPGAERINLLAQAYADQLVTGYAQAAGRKALSLAGPDAVAATVEAEVRAHMEAMSTSAKGLAGDTFGAALSSAQSAARLEVFAQFPDAVYRAEEVNDPSRCSRCAEIDQTEFQGLAAALVAYPGGGGHWACEGGLRCRGTFRIEAL